MASAHRRVTLCPAPPRDLCLRRSQVQPSSIPFLSSSPFVKPSRRVRSSIDFEAARTPPSSRAFPLLPATCFFF
ncbi:hypothetical protein Csa_023143 [Cucumis sativus]|nr:hypothetical protein Csa_023143 [Cucumis sativus]